MNNNILTQSKKYHERGTAYFLKNKTPFNNAELKRLCNYCEKVEKEFIEIGDAGEKNHLLVGRFMTDIKKPLIVKNPYSKKLLKILSQKKVFNFIKNTIKEKKDIFLRRVQFNQIDKNCFVGYHLDKDSNPDYVAACVLQLGSKFSGGKYRVYKPKTKKYIDYTPTFGSMLISDCNFAHEVTKVNKGKRKSLVFFISFNKGRNRRN
tara:strand:- start:4679 stop:5296 length:618 start_codon:yes stop_codon:yes gene_type:complete